MMGLDLRFAETGNGLYLIANDGCAQQKNEDEEERYLFNTNMELVELWFYRGPIDLGCPVCGERYQITREQVDNALYDQYRRNLD